MGAGLVFLVTAIRVHTKLALLIGLPVGIVLILIGRRDAFPRRDDEPGES
jgi:hypothetical protein